MEPAIRLYAELLLHIRSVTLSGSVRSFTASESIARLFTDGNIITVSHEGSTASIELPAKTIGTAAAEVTIPAGEPRELSSRLQIDGDLSELLTLRDDDADNVVPWSAPSLHTDCSICCQKCCQTVVGRGKLQAWKDLPSANWAEMMDFWHCHKPPTEQDNSFGEAGMNKGYSASSRVKAVSGTGLVDLSSFLLSPEDCTSIQIVNSSQDSKVKPSLQCGSCHNDLGSVDDLASGWRLYKWCLAVSFPESTASVSHPREKWLASQLLSIAESNGVRKFTLRIAESEGEAKLIWLFSPDLYFCSSTSNTKGASKAIRAAKVLWRSIPVTEYTSLQNASSVEDLDLPNDMGSTLLEVLVANQDLLPQAMREYQGWDVSLLTRFGPENITGAGAGHDAVKSNFHPL